jgi:3-deoxy-D-manno-octulosonate 8-phosphate phosphatase (KDO 8-P phosphatase)
MRIRLNTLGITDVFQGVGDKISVFENYCAEQHIDPQTVLYMGDDIPDYFPMKHVALACCPADAAIEIQEISHYTSHKKGGDGCVRDIIEQVLKSQNKWMCDESAHLW